MVPRPTDVFIATPPKTGTTWLQHALHCLRTACAASDSAIPIPSFQDTMFQSEAEYEAWKCAQQSPAGGWPKQAMNYEDIYQVSPWDQLAWDLGMNLNDEQPCNPRLYKSHLPLSSLRSGAKYIVTVRDPAKTMLSWYAFLRDKKVPPVCVHEADGGKGVSGFVHDKSFVTEDMRFGASLWQYYAEYMKALNDPTVLVLVYEDMVKDFGAQLRKVAAFLELKPSNEIIDAICDMSTKRFMSLPEHAPKFEEIWTYRRLIEVGRVRDASSFATPVTRVNVKAHKDVLSEDALGHLSDLWSATLGEAYPDYSSLCMAIRASHARRFGEV